MAFKIHYQGKIIGNNQRYAYRSKKVNSKEYNDFKTYVHYLCKQQNPKKNILDNKIEVTILYNSNHDIDGILKGIFDAIEGVVYNNDRQIKRLRVEENKQIEKGFILFANQLPDNTTTNADSISANIAT